MKKELELLYRKNKIIEMKKVQTIISGLAAKLTVFKVFHCLTMTFFVYIFISAVLKTFLQGTYSIQDTSMRELGVWLVLGLVLVLGLRLCASALVAVTIVLVNQLKAFRFYPVVVRILKGICKMICMFFIPLALLACAASLYDLVRYGIFGFIAAPLWLVLSWYWCNRCNNFDE